MATFNNIVEYNDPSFLTCDGCSSSNIQETIQGYVCADCGLVLEMYRLQYHRPYNEDIVHYAKLGNTQIGTKSERMRSQYSFKLESLNKLHSFKDNEKKVIDDAKVEILRILGSLKISKKYLELILPKVKEVRAKFRPSTKYRSVEKLVPPILFYCLKNHGVSVNLEKLLDIIKIKKSEFNHFRLQVKAFFPKWNKTKRQIYISQKLCELKNYFHLDMSFVYRTKKVMSKLWPLINNTTDDVITGVSASITILCFYKEKINICSICKVLGIQMSTIQFQVKNRIFKNLGVKGFSSLIRSAGIIQTIMEKLGIFELKKSRINHCESIVMVELGNAIKIFNTHRKAFDHYLLGMLMGDREPLIMDLRILDHTSERSSLKQFSRELFELKLFKYSHGKDPPSNKV